MIQYILYLHCVCIYVLVITPPGGIWLIYKHDPQGRKVPGGGAYQSAVSRLEVL